PKKSLYQTDSSPISTGRFFSNGAVRKCSSIWWKPLSIERKLSGPIAIIDERPIAESIEYRPPTQSQNPNMLAVSIPNADTFSAFVDTATKCFATALGSPPSPLSDQSRVLCALVVVSSVVRVFDETTDSFSAGLRSPLPSTTYCRPTFHSNL